ncbi:MAG: O-antigen polysaccharide polymerase Wzy [Clostridiales bacterium]|nr:O-antigen polysaccharide polymerase Wzy [Clostridiales bacterium]
MKDNNYSRKVVYKRPLLIIMYLIISFLFVILMINIRNVDFYIWSKYFTVIIISQFIFQYMFFKLIEFKLFSLTGMFLVLSYLFHFGQLVIMVLFPDYEFGRFNFFTFYDSQGLKIASEFALITIIMVGFGILISLNNRNVNINVNIIFKDTLSQCRKIGWIIVFFTFPIQIYVDMTKLIISITKGYLATYQAGIAGIWESIGFISFIGFTLLILGYKEQKEKSLLIFAFIIIYLFLTMISGHRGHQLTIILFLAYIVHMTVYRVRGKKLIFISAIVFIGLAFLNTLATFRDISGKTITVFWKLMLDNLEGDSIKDMIVELGGTINTLYLVMKQVPDIISYTYGATYPLSIFSIIPNIGNSFTNINTFAYYVKNLHGSALGGSYIGELYYNFSYFGLLIAPFVGFFVNWISNKVEFLIYNKDYFKLAYYAPLFIYILWWPRDTFYSMLRPFVWSAVILFVLNNIIKNE